MPHLQLRPGLHWIRECYPHGQKHVHVSAYLLTGEGGSVLIDSGSYRHEADISGAIDEVAGAPGLDALILSHPDLPHSGNARRFQDEHQLDLITFSAMPKIHGLSDVVPVEKGTTRHVAGRKFHFIDPPLLDVPSTAWIYDHSTGALFTVDGFGNYHRPDDCDTTVDETELAVEFEDVYEFHRDALRWLKYVDPQLMLRSLDSLFTDLDVTCIAPTHGNPILPPAISPYRDLLAEAITTISNEFSAPNVEN